MEVEEENEVSLEAKGSSFLESETRMANKEMKNKKSTGNNNVSAEVITNLEEKAKEQLVLLCKRGPMYDKSAWPDDFITSIAVTYRLKRSQSQTL